jgi:hypothetical protein
MLLDHSTEALKLISVIHQLIEISAPQQAAKAEGRCGGQDYVSHALVSR